jgi:hypothetical protein
MDTILESKPARHPDAAVENVGGRMMVATPDDRLHYFVEDGTDDPSAVGDFILALADGKRTVREIAKAVCEQFEVDLETALHDTAELVSDLVRCRVLTFAGGGQSGGQVR